MLLQKLHDTRMCDQLLEEDTVEGVWKAGQGSGSDAVLSRTKSLEGMSAQRVWILNYYGILKAFHDQPDSLSIFHITRCLPVATERKQISDHTSKNLQNLCKNIKDVLHNISLDTG
jgi:hypothetical protein